MLLLEWTREVLKHGVQLFSDTIIKENDKGIKVTTDVSRLRSICVGAISCNNAEEFYRVCRLHAPVGTIIEDYSNDWTDLFDNTIALCRVALTKALLDERNAKSAKVLFDILSRRDSTHWADSKQVDVKTNDNQNISISIVGV